MEVVCLLPLSACVQAVASIRLVLRADFSLSVWCEYRCKFCGSVQLKEMKESRPETRAHAILHEIWKTSL